jgi:hypothetical protein
MATSGTAMIECPWVIDYLSKEPPVFLMRSWMVKHSPNGIPYPCVRPWGLDGVLQSLEGSLRITCKVVLEIMVLHMLYCIQSSIPDTCATCYAAL